MYKPYPIYCFYHNMLSVNHDYYRTWLVNYSHSKTWCGHSCGRVVLLWHINLLDDRYDGTCVIDIDKRNSAMNDAILWLLLLYGCVIISCDYIRKSSIKGEQEFCQSPFALYPIRNHILDGETGLIPNSVLSTLPSGLINFVF